MVSAQLQTAYLVHEKEIIYFSFQETRKRVVDGKPAVDMIVGLQQNIVDSMRYSQCKVMLADTDILLIPHSGADPENFWPGRRGQILTIFSNKTTMSLFITTRLN